MKMFGQQYDPLIPLVIGTQTAATNQFTGVLPLDQLKHGQSIRYWLPYAGKSSGNTLNLTLRDGSTTGEIQLYYKGSTKLTTQFSAGSLIMLTYLENANVGGVTYTGWWADGAVQSASGGSSSADHTHTWEEVATAEILEDLIITSDDVNYGGYHKVSDEVPTLEQLQKGGTVSFNEGGNGIVTMNYPVGDITVMTLGATNGAGIVFNGLTLAAVAFEDGARVLGTTLDEKGIYFVQNDMVITHSLTISEYAPATEVVPIPYEFLPESHQFGDTTTYGGTLTWDGDMTGKVYAEMEMPIDEEGNTVPVYFVKVSDSVPTFEDLQSGGTAMAYQGGASMTISWGNDTDFYYIDAGNVMLDETMQLPMIAKEDNVNVMDMFTLPEKGVYVMSMPSDGIYIGGFTISNYTGFETVKTSYFRNKYLDFMEKVGSDTLEWDGGSCPQDELRYRWLGGGKGRGWLSQPYVLRKANGRGGVLR